MITLRTHLNLINKLLELLVRLLKTLVKIVETFRKTIEKKLTAQTVNQSSSFVIHVLMILVAQALMVVLLNITGK